MLQKKARAKINLWLRVLRRRDDGFHEIDTRMVEVELADDLTLEVSDDENVLLECSEPDLPVDESNLVMKAARLLERELGRPLGLRMKLEKRIPHGAGLGGGSSDAAAALSGVVELLNLEIEPERLRELAGEIGSDVPFFLEGGACDCRGRGELVTTVPFDEQFWILLAKPAFSVPTPWAYQQWRDSKCVDGLDYNPQEFPWGTLVNDLERPVFAKHLVLGLLKRWLGEQPGVDGSLMSGSGATVFALLKNEAEGEKLAREVRREFGDSTWTCVTRTRPGLPGERDPSS